LVNLHPSWKKIGCISIPSKSIQVSCMETWMQVYVYRALYYAPGQIKNTYQIQKRNSWKLTFMHPLPSS
jgi:hypothetical protein